MSAAHATPGLEAPEQDRAEGLFAAARLEHYRRTDRLMAGLLAFEWLAGIFVAAVLSPRTWEGTAYAAHPHLWLAIFLGGAICLFPILLAVFRPGQPITRYCTAAAQMLYSALLIHLTGGRIETHFHVFGSLAFLAFYRDWKVLVPATLVVALDHFVRGSYFPLSVFGVLTASPWRWLEHAGWVVFEDAFLVYACLQGEREMRSIAAHRASLEATKASIERQVLERTEKLRASEEQVKRAEERLRSILSSASDAIVSLDKEGRIAEYNRAAEQMFGWKREEMLGGTLARIVPQYEAVEQRIAMLHNLRASRLNVGEHQFIELNALTRGGAAVAVECSLSSFQFANGPAVTAILRDMTQRKKAEEERKHLEIQLRQAHKLEAIGQLAAGIAHEINTPMQFIGDNTRFLQDAFGDLSALHERYAELAAKARKGEAAAADWAALEQAERMADLEFLATEIPKAIAQSLDGANRVTEIVKAMKEFSHPGNQEKKSVDVNEAIRSTLIIARNEYKYVADISSELDPKLPLTPCLPGELSQVFLNLLVNAAHAIADQNRAIGRARGTIHVSTRTVRNNVEIRIRDNGTGIPEPAQARIFEPFFTTKDVGQGTGQGLAMAHAVIADKHGGSLTFETAIGQGTTFVIRLPLTERRGRFSTTSMDLQAIAKLVTSAPLQAPVLKGDAAADRAERV